jgi:hypothetical protein
MSNIIGSCTANILGSFSIGLLSASAAAPLRITMNERSSARLYTFVLIPLVASVIVTGPAWPFVMHRFDGTSAGRWAGIVLIVAFVVYIAGISYGIQRGTLVPPEGSDSDSDSNSDSDSGHESVEPPAEDRPVQTVQPGEHGE